MPTTISQRLAVAATQVPAGFHTRLPAWLAGASDDKRQALKNAPLDIANWQAEASRQQHAPLKQAVEQSWTAQSKVDTALADLKTPQAFAAPLLHQALKTRWGVDIDVSTTHLRLYAPLTIPLFPIETGGVKVWTVSLVDAALHNFDAAESEQAAFTADSSFITQPSSTGQFDTLPTVNSNVSVQTFVGLCRELDIGTQYHAYLKTFFGFQDATRKSALRSTVIDSLKAEAQAAVHLARLKKDGSEAVLRTLQAQLKGISGLTLDGKTLLSHDLSLMGAPLAGVVLFAADLELHHSAVPVVVYIPGDPQAPLKYYRDGIAFIQDLTRKLRDADYQAFFSRFISHEHRAYFFANLNNRLSQITWHAPIPGDPRPTWRAEPVANPKLQLHATKISGELYEHLYESKLNRLLNDARSIAVSTADADSKARWQRWDIVAKIGKTLLEIAAFIATPFIPPLGALMLGYTAYQLLDDVFEGIVDWAEGLKRQAFGHLMSILEQMVQLGMFAVGAPIAEGLLRQALPREVWDFFERLHPVTSDDGKTRLWNADLSPYAHDLQLPAASRPRADGLHAYGDKQILPLKGQHFAVKQQADNTVLVHPSHLHAYPPPIIGNGKGAWLTPLDRPLTWDRSTLLRRLGPPADSLSDTDLEQALRISSTDDGALRKLYMDHQPPPPLLADSLKRIHIDQQLQTFIDQMNNDDPQVYSKADTQTQLWLLSQTGLWPETKTLRFLNAKGETVWEHPGRENAAVAQIHEAQMNNGDLLKTLLETLDEPERKTLLEEDFGTPTTQLHVRAAKLRKQLARRAEDKRASMFDSRYRGLELTTDARVQKIIDSTPGLPVSAAEEVLLSANGQDLLDIDQGVLPSHLVERARWAAHQVRISRAYEGLYMSALESGDTHRLALHSLEQLPGWSPQVRLEVRDFKRDGQLHDAIGPAQAPIRRLLVRTIEGDYIPEDSKGTLLGETDFYTAVLQALPDEQRDALNMQIGQGPHLRETLRQHTLARDELGPLLAEVPLLKPSYDPTLMRLPGGMEGYDASPATAGSSRDAVSLEARLHELYPQLNPSELTAVLAAMHNDPGTPLGTLQLLKKEFLQLDASLRAWQQNVPQTLVGTDLPLSRWRIASEQQNRRLWAQKLISAWRHATPRDAAFDNGHLLQLNQPIYGELPVLEASFGHITSLELLGYLTTRGTPAFLGRFPGLRRLAISDIALRTLPDEVSALTHLNALVLRNCALNLTTPSRAALANLTELHTLDLSNNPLALAPNLGNMTDLRTLNLAHSEISVFPSGLLNRPRLVSANLSNNRLRRLPDALFSLPAGAARAYDLSGNPLSRTTLERIKTYCQNTGEHFGANANPAEVRLAQALYPTYSTYEANQFIFSLPGGLDDSMATLVRLKADYERLQADLQEWVADVPARYPFTDVPMDEQVRAQQQLIRGEIRALLEQVWRRETDLDFSHDTQARTHQMVLTLPLLGDLPKLNVDFKHVSKLELRAQEATSIPEGFLERFPNLESLLIDRYVLKDIPAAVFKLPKLNTLSLTQCQLRLTRQSVDALSDLHDLNYLDLSDNPLGLTPDVSKMSGMETLMMENAGLTEVPRGTFNLTSLTQLNLSDNRITELPTDLIEVDPDAAAGFDLSDNPFSPAALAILRRYYNRTAVDFDVAQARQPAPDDSGSSSSTSSETDNEP
ncbi:leucine-rich repeat domain-containing protein [Pseudomonas salmasensis]|uniref:Leucine-rich repeat domain-containing protein n=1 Tax=Pseudomonas salmasensis TaxID=2745514 RepID=A0ABU5FCI4_9PSED|nr:leucine-rich repeat domain-containing protein [Pseudomonas salmasensis]MDY4299873.1 leucine-rich repeat domain-containing protein [Pseudomonas salmasensis]